MKGATAKDIMSSPVVTIGPDAPVVEAARTMLRASISGLPVVDTDGRLVGILTEGDLQRRAAGPGGLSELAYMHGARAGRAEIDGRQDDRAGSVAGSMTEHVAVAGEGTSVREIARMMNRHGVNRIPIVRDGAVVGIVARADILGLFDRPAEDIERDAVDTIRDDLRLDPDRFRLEVSDGVLRVGGTADAGEVALLRALLAAIDGVVSVDTSGISSTETR